MIKIPDNAKLVFKGVLHSVYQWDQEMYDGTTAVFEALKKNDTTTILAVTDNKIIINFEEQPMLSPFIALPGGMTDDNEQKLDNAKRELLEEAGYTSEDWELLWVTDILHYTKMEWNNNLFIARNCTKVAEQKLDSGEKIENKLYTFDEFMELVENPKFRNKDIANKLKEIKHNEEEKQKFKALLGITT
jgi:8-oxo-dGTP pyrophosphatase MutT (NUDIX family)